MREIKFRAWTGTEMVKPCNLWDRDDAPIEWLNDLPYPDSVLMQCTGLKDKNGTEIYEGDIVRVTYIRGYAIYVVQWHSPGWDLEYKYADGVSAWFEYDGTPYQESIMNNNLEVIGNIYENPELLEGRGK